MSRFTAAQLHGLIGARVKFVCTNLDTGVQEELQGIITDVAHHGAVHLDAVRIYTEAGFKVTLPECVREVMEVEVAK